MKEKLKPLKEEIEIPEGVEVAIDGNEILVKKGDREIKKKLPGVILESKDSKIIVQTKKSTKREYKVLKTYKAHINNMIRGVLEEYTYILEIAYVHFPMSVEHDKTNNKLIIKNFLGEKKPRIAKLIKEVDVEVDKNKIIIKSPDKELAGQTVTRIEKATHISNKDRRKFQDGIFLIEKPGRVS